MHPPLAAAFERLTLSTDQLLTEVESLANPNAPAPDGGWSGAQIVRHLIGSETGITALLAKQAGKAAAELPEAGLRNWFASQYMSWQLTRAGKRFQAPARLKPPVADPITMLALRAEWATVRDDLQRVLEKWPAALQGRAVFQHPRAGWLTLPQTLRFMADHVQHHRQQVARLTATA